MVIGVSLAAPYLSVLTICRLAPVGRQVSRHAALTLPVGWAAVLGLRAARRGIWAPPMWAVVACAALSGLAMMTPGDGRDDDGPEEHDDDPPPMSDWDAFAAARRRWERFGRGPMRPRARTG